MAWSETGLGSSDSPWRLKKAVTVGGLSVVCAAQGVSGCIVSSVCDPLPDAALGASFVAVVRQVSFGLFAGAGTVAW